MTLFSIDQEKCRQDGICAAVCPLGLIRREGENAFPHPIEKAEELCINCGHCSAVCPHNALQLKRLRSCEPALFDRKKMPAPEQLEHLIRGRRSIRAYKKEKVSRQTMSEIISLARYSPTAKNSQTIQWLVIDSACKIKTLKNHVKDWMQSELDKNEKNAVNLGFETILQLFAEGVDPILRGAPGIILLHTPESYPSGIIDSAIATTTFELIAACRGIGTCWAGYFVMAANSWAPLRRELMIPEGHQITTALMIGHPKFSYTTLPEREAPVITWC